jgi:hypothetical protein
VPTNGATTKIYGGNAKVLIGAIGLLALGFAVMIIVRTLHLLILLGLWLFRDGCLWASLCGKSIAKALIAIPHVSKL